MKTQNKKHAEWINGEFERTGKSKIGLAKALGIDSAGITRLLKGGRGVQADEVAIIQNYFAANDGAASGMPPDGIPEIDVRAGAGGGGIAAEDFAQDRNGDHFPVDRVAQTWGLPDKFIRNELRTRRAAIAIVEVLGDSMEPTLRPGDRILVDTDHKAPSPPGVFAVWDGFGVVVKRVEIVPLSNPPMVRLISDNKNHQTYEASPEDARIIGRVICKISVM